MNDLMKNLSVLVKTLEAGQYNVAPGQLVQGSALQIENLESVMHNVCISEDEIKLQKLFTIKKAKSTHVQFMRQLSYGRLGGSAQREGAVGNKNMGDYQRFIVPMCYYSKVTQYTLAANLVDTFDGIKAEDRQQDDLAKVLAMDIEFDIFKGKADYSNAGIFDGNSSAIAEVPNLMGVDPQVRMSDSLASTQDLMFASYGSSRSVILAKNGALDQPFLEDIALRQRMNHGTGGIFYVDPVVLAGYNKAVALGQGVNAIQRIHLAGSPQDASGADLRRQWTTSGTVQLEDSRFLSGKTSPLRPQIGSPAAPATATGVASGSGAQVPAGAHVYLVTAENEIGEGVALASAPVTVTAGQLVTLTIANVAGAHSFNVYRGASAETAEYIGRVKNSGAATTAFIDLGNKFPGFVTGYLIQKDTWGMHELMPFSKIKLPSADLSEIHAQARFVTLAGYKPRFNIIADNLS